LLAKKKRKWKISKEKIQAKKNKEEWNKSPAWMEKVEN